MFGRTEMVTLEAKYSGVRSRAYGDGYIRSEMFGRTEMVTLEAKCSGVRR
jgi:hypothetical protein